MTLSELYGAVEGHKKCDGNSHWKDKIRQTLYVNRFEKRPMTIGVLRANRLFKPEK